MTIAHTYKKTLDAPPVDKQPEPVWEQPGFEATISYTPVPYREKILTFSDGSVYDYEMGLAYSRKEWEEEDKFVSI